MIQRVHVTRVDYMVRARVHMSACYSDYVVRPAASRGARLDKKPRGAMEKSLINAVHPPDHLAAFSCANYGSP
jgi:anti-sigma factor RsiW